MIRVNLLPTDQGGSRAWTTRWAGNSYHAPLTHAEPGKPYLLLSVFSARPGVTAISVSVWRNRVASRTPHYDVIGADRSGNSWSILTTNDLRLALDVRDKDKDAQGVWDNNRDAWVVLDDEDSQSPSD